MIADQPSANVTSNYPTYKLGSRAAQMWLSGREAAEGKPRIVGFEDFARSLAHITRASAKDNPFADARLLKIEHTLREVESFLDRRRGVYHSMFDLDAKEIDRPPLYFESISYTPATALPLALSVLTTVVKADGIVLLLNSLVHYGMKTKKQYKIEERGISRRIRNLLGSAGSWKFFPVSRADLLARNEIAEEAIAFFKGFPAAEVMDKTLTPDYARPVDQPTGSIDPIKADLSDLIRVGHSVST